MRRVRRPRRIAELFLLDGNAALPDTALNAGIFLPFLVEVIGEDRDDDNERADDGIENVPAQWPGDCLYSSGIR
jgi:hypothetical protein